MPDAGDVYTLREIKDPGPTKRALTLSHTDETVGTFSYVPDVQGIEEPWTGTFKMQDPEMTTWVVLTVEKGGQSTGKKFKTMIDTNSMWFENLENYIARNSKAKAGEATEPAEVLEMKVTMKKPAGFYKKSLSAFLKGVEAKPADGDKEAVEAKPPVDQLKVSGLGEAINVAVSAAVGAEIDGSGKIIKIETKYPEMTGGRGCAQIVITMERV